MLQRVVGAFFDANIAIRYMPFVPIHFCKVIMNIIYAWVHKLRVGQVLELLSGEVACKDTVINWFSLCLGVFSMYLVTHPIMLDGVWDKVGLGETKVRIKHKCDYVIMIERR